MDRDYWRSEPTKRLIEEARSRGCELCIALGERLEDADAEIAEEADKWENISIESDDTISQLREQIEELDLMLGQREERIEQLEAQLKGTK
jgi:predicted RNase H-like nuclease (RuvC/YqgF family)